MNMGFTSPKILFEHLQKSVRLVVPKTRISDSVLKHKAELVCEINLLAAKKNALILKHNYMEPILFYAVSGVSGDSLELSRKAAQAKADIIVFCGVHFMAETAKILNPSTKVLIPWLKAGCSLADEISPDDILMLKTRFPKLPVVTYVNSTASTKAESDVCCTSGNVQKVVDWALREYQTKSLIFLPDKYMAQNIANERRANIFFPTDDVKLDKQVDFLNKPTVIAWKARCYVHEKFTVSQVTKIKRNLPGCKILTHPECPPEVVKASDFAKSTSGMANYVKEYGKSEKIALFTECAMADNLLMADPDLVNNLIRPHHFRCRFMKMITLERLRDTLLNEQYQIEVPEKIREKAETAVKRMIAIS